MQKTFKRGFLDRYDGWRVRDIDPALGILPFFLRTRVDSQVFFEERIPLDHIDEFIRQHKEDIPDLSLMHVIIAAVVRTIAQRPRLNRFIIYNKMYARNHINVSFAIKRSLSEKGDETLIKPDYDPTDTLVDVVQKIKAALDETQKPGSENDSDSTSKLLALLPSFVRRSLVGILRFLDSFGKLPKFINRISPFHCSCFLTNVGSIGLDSIYHHLYEFGTCSMFVAMGRKNRAIINEEDGSAKITRSISLKFVCDERICDGYYYASAMRYLRRCLLSPESLLVPPKTVPVDDGVPQKKLIKN